MKSKSQAKLRKLQKIQKFSSKNIFERLSQPKKGC